MKLSQGPIKYAIACWTPLGTTSIYTKETMSGRPWNSRSPKDIFEGSHYPLTWSNGLCSGRDKWGALVEKGKGPWQTNNVIIHFWWFFFGWREDEDKKRQENGQTWYFSKTAFFEQILKKVSTFTFWCMVMLLGPHSSSNMNFRKEINMTWVPNIFEVMQPFRLHDDNHIDSVAKFQPLLS